MGEAGKTILLFGPTAVGKTPLLFDVFRTGFEVVNADSMQVYRGMDIGTAKPTPDQRRKLPHHLIDIRNPDQQYTVGDFVRDADAAVAEITGRERIPVLSGGTAFYFRNYLFGLPETPPSDQKIRNRLRRRLAEEGSAALHAELAAVDPKSAVRIAVADGYRITRALEVYELTGHVLSDIDVPQAVRPGVDALTIGLYRERTDLHRRIEARVSAMFDAGLSEEVRRLRDAGYAADDPGMRAIGYREFFDLDDVGEIRERIVIASRQYAKRQMTFFRRLPGVEWVHADDSQAVSDLVRRYLR